MPVRLREWLRDVERASASAIRPRQSRQIALDVGETPAPEARKTVGYQLQRDGLAGAGRAGNEAVSIASAGWNDSGNPPPSAQPRMVGSCRENRRRSVGQTAKKIHQLLRSSGPLPSPRA